MVTRAPSFLLMRKRMNGLMSDIANGTLSDMNREVRAATLDTAAVTRQAGESEERGGVAFCGHAAVFDTSAVIGGMRYGFVERVAQGAFDDVLQGDTRFLHNHNPDLLLARTTNGTLRLAQDKRGLATDADFARVSLAEDLAMWLERGDITQMSYAFTVKDEEWETLGDDHPDFPGMEMRTITKIGTLYDVSTVTYPAFEDTDAGLRVCNASEAEVRGIMSSRLSERDVAQAAQRAYEREVIRCAARAALYGIKE